MEFGFKGRTKRSDFESQENGELLVFVGRFEVWNCNKLQ
jgi:hypothetical protein